MFLELYKKRPTLLTGVRFDLICLDCGGEKVSLQCSEGWKD